MNLKFLRFTNKNLNSMVILQEIWWGGLNRGFITQK